MSSPGNPKTKASKIGSGFLYTALGFLILGVICFISGWTMNSWSGLIPVLIGILCGMIALILGIVGIVLKVIGRTPAVAPTEEQQAKRTKNTQRNLGIFAAISGGIAIFCCFAFLAPVDVINAKYHSLDKLRASAPKGIDFDKPFNNEDGLRFCNRLSGDEFCYTDSQLEGNATIAHEPAEYCKLIFDWVSKNEAKTWTNAYNRFEFTKDDPIAKLACVTGNMRAIAGQSGEYQWELTLDLFSMPGYFFLSTFVEEFGAVSDYDSYVADWQQTDPAQAATLNTLNHIGAWRKAHPNAPVSEQNIREAIKGVGLKKVQVFSQKDKSTYLAYQNQGDPSQTVCLSVSKFDEKFFGTKDPGHGYFPFYNETSGAIGQFGVFSPTGCGQD